MTSFAQMHEDHLDPDKHLWPDDPPCDRCRWDNEGECHLTVGCTFEEKKGATTSALSTQVGGGHYKDMAIQPVEFITKNNLGFLEGCIVKRICRWRKKDGRKDLEKIKHEVDLLIEMEFGN